MATTIKKYLDLNGLQYVLSKLSYTKPENSGKFLTGLTETKGVISGTWADLDATDIPKLGTPTAYSAATALTGSVATITNTITRDAGDALTASFKLGVSGNLSLTRADNGDLTIGYTTPAESVKGVKTDGYLTLGADDKLLDINSAKLANASTAAGAAGTLLTTKAYVDKQVSAAIAGGVQYKGTTATVPASPANGDMYKVTTDIAKTTDFPGAKAGDVIIYHTTSTAGWDVIPSGDDVEYTGIKVGDTTVIGATKGGDATFAAGNGLSVAGEAGKVTYSHAVPTGAALTALGFYKIATDKFGHIAGTKAVGKEDITKLLGDYVTTFGTKKGAITLKNGYTAEANPGSINLTMVDNELNAAIVGLGTAAFEAKEAFAAAKHTHTAEEVTYDGTTSKLTATKVQGAIDELVEKIDDVKASAGVTSFGGQKGDITVNTTGATNGSINFTVGTDKILKGTVAGWDTKQDAITDGTAKIVDAISANVTYAAYTTDTTAETATIYATVAQDGGAIKDGSADGLTISNIIKSEIDALFAAK